MSDVEKQEIEDGIENEEIDELEGDGDATHPGDDEAGEVEEAKEAPPAKPADEEPVWLSSFNKRMETVVNALNRYNNNPTTQNQKGVEKAKSRLESMLESEDIDLEPTKAIRELVSEFQSREQREDETSAQYRRRMEQQDALINNLYSQVEQLRFENQYPELKGKYEELVNKTDRDMGDARQRIANTTDPVAIELYNKLWGERFAENVKAASSPAEKTPDKSTKSAVKKPKGTAPLKGAGSRSGNAPTRKSLAELLYGSPS